MLFVCYVNLEEEEKEEEAEGKIYLPDMSDGKHKEIKVGSLIKAEKLLFLVDNFDHTKDKFDLFPARAGDYLLVLGQPQIFLTLFEVTEQIHYIKCLKLGENKIGWLNTEYEFSIVQTIE